VSDGGPALYVYGVVRAPDAPQLDSLGVGDRGARLSDVVHGGVAAIVSEVDEGPLAAARDLRAHWRVLEDVAKRTTVVPVRFGTVMAGREELVQEFLAPQADSLAALLGELDGRVQLSIKAFYDEERLLGEVVSGSPAVAQLREKVKGMPEAAGYYERIRLGELVSGEVERCRERDTAAVLARLEPLAVAAKNEDPGTADTAVNATFLVEEERVAEFSKAVGQLTEELGERLRMRYLGPMPPYSFADADMAAGSGSWA